MRDHRVDVRKHFRERVRSSLLGVAEHVVHRRRHEPLFGHFDEQLGVRGLAAVPPRAAVHKEEERRGPIDLADVPGQIEVVRLRDVRMHGTLAHLPSAVWKILAHVSLRARRNLYGMQAKRLRVRVSGENARGQDRAAKRRQAKCPLHFHVLSTG